MMGNSKLVLVTGGARSGKSDFAERYAAVLPGRHAYVATAFVSDDEMARRIALHRKRRPASWATWEVPHHLPDVVDDLCKSADVVLVDCLTIYFSIICGTMTERVTMYSWMGHWRSLGPS